MTKKEEIKEKIEKELKNLAENLEEGLKIAKRADELTKWAISQGWEPYEFYCACMFCALQAIRPERVDELCEAIKGYVKSNKDHEYYSEEEVKELRRRKEREEHFYIG